MNNEEFTTTLAAQIEALLFTLARPVGRNELAKKLNTTPEAVEQALTELRARLTGGITLVDDTKTVELRTAAAAAQMLEEIQKEENSRDIGKAGLEALAAVLYRGPLTRAEVDFIRGVNSSQTLRSLTMRGLLRKIDNPKDSRSFLYEPTTELFAYLGIAAQSHLPDYAEVRTKLEQLEDAYHAKDSEQQ